MYWKTKISPILLMLGCSLAGGVVLDRPLKTEQELRISGYDASKMKISGNEQEKYLEITLKKNEEVRFFWQLENAQELSGKSLEISFEIEMDGEKQTRNGGGSFVVWTPGTDPKQFGWEELRLPAENRKWTGISKKLLLPVQIRFVRFTFEFKGMSGKIRLRNFKVQAEEYLPSLERDANMGFRDPVEGDGKGGWSDQGPNQDAAKFPIGRIFFAGIPFRIIDPRKNAGRSIVVFRSSRFPRGADSVRIDVPENRKPWKNLYLLHATAWGMSKGGRSGEIEVRGEKGSQMIPVRSNEDVCDSYLAKAQGNAVPGAVWQAKDTILGVFVSRFELNPELGKVREIILRPSANSSEMWMLLGATLSERDLVPERPEQKERIIQADAVWKALPPEFIPAPKKGSALDLSSVLKNEPVGTRGRVIVNADGHFAFEQTPDQPIRFLCCGNGNEFYSDWPARKMLAEGKTHADIEQYAEQFARCGYNLMRESPTGMLRTGKEENWQFNPERMDRFDYLVYCLKKRGVYLQIDLMGKQFGYDKAVRFWDRNDKRNYRRELYYLDAAKTSWINGVRNFLHHRNPYTGLQYKDDPVIAMVIGFNEQEFAFLYEQGNYEGLRPLLREFLQKKYKTPDALRKAWGKEGESIVDFSQIPDYRPSRAASLTPLGRDYTEFVTELEKGIVDWYTKQLREMGYRGLISNFNVAKSLKSALTREKCDFVSMNSYHTHPSGSYHRSGSIQQASSIGASANIMRGFLGTRLYRKPMLITEHGHVFWNRYRYENGFVMGGYSALNGLDGLNVFYMPLTIRPQFAPIYSFHTKHDPIVRATEFLTALLFRRGDVRPSAATLRIRIRPESIFAENLYTQALSSVQSSLGLVAALALDPGTLPPGKNELILSSRGGASIQIRKMHADVIDTKTPGPFQFDEAIRAMKKKGLLSQNNATSYVKDRYESSTGELLLDANRKFMRIDTPRFQGICALAGSRAKLSDFSVESMNRNGCIAAVSVDGMNALRQSKRIVLVIATNALNSGMVFEDQSMSVLKSLGEIPALIETGSFSLILQNDFAEQMKLFALAPDGTRLAELPLQRKGRQLRIHLDTGKTSRVPGVFYELALP